MIRKHLFSMLAGSVALLTTTASLAVSFNSFDPRSMAMGGAGVAVPNPATAPFFNPALLSIAKSKDDFAIEFPVFGIRVYDPDNFVDAIDDFDDTVVDDLDASISNFDAVRNSGDNAAIIDALNDVSDNVLATNNEVLKLSDKPFQFEGGLGIVIAVPGEKFGIAVTASGSANMSGILEYEDAETVTTLTSDLDILNDCYQSSLNNPSFDFAACISTASLSDFIDISDPNNPVIDFTAASNVSDPTDINSTVKVLGVIMAEAGVTVSREFAISNTEVAIGLTPKIVSVTILDYEASADAAESDKINGDDYTADYSDFNLDVGVAMDHKNGWRSGVVIKNIISHDYDGINADPTTGVESKTGNTISLEPQIRAGVSHSNGWSTLAVDVDITENKGLGLASDDSRYIALGAEFNAFDWAQLRVGYRVNTANSDRSVMSAGVGVSPFGIHMDLGVSGNQDEIGAAFQLGFRF